MTFTCPNGSENILPSPCLSCSKAGNDARKVRRRKGLVSGISGNMFVIDRRRQCIVCASARYWIDRACFSSVAGSKEASGGTLLYLSFTLAGKQEAFEDWLLSLKCTQR